MVTYPNLLEKSIFTLIIALSDTEVGKVILPNPYQWVDTATGEPVQMGKYPTLDAEIPLLQYANGVNDLMPQFIRQETWTLENGETHPMMVMERLYPLPIHHYPLKLRQAMFRVFELEMKELHLHEWVHGDFMRPTNYHTRNNLEWIFKNIVQTEGRLRLMDTGFSMRYSTKEHAHFRHALRNEKEEIAIFEKYYLEKPFDNDI
ncbi:MAG: hypothetical protein RL329_433 [Bacteroidota bacterium]|jgi:hypothetical protein